MPEKKPSYIDLVNQVVRETSEPLPFVDIMQRAASVLPIVTKNPKSTVCNAISQNHLIVNTGDGCYGWMYRVNKGSMIRLSISESDLSQLEQENTMNQIGFQSRFFQVRK